MAPTQPAPFTGTPWWEKRIVGFDLETTHADPEQARIVAAAVVCVGADEPTTWSSWLVDPGIAIPADATAVHGITTEHAQDAGDFAGDVIPAIIDQIARRPHGSAVVVFHARYDLTVLDREARRYGVPPLTERGPLFVVDPFVIDKQLDRYRPGLRQLVPMAEHYAAHIDEPGGRDDAHDATYDARLACRLAWQIVHHGKVIRRDARDANHLQAEWDRIRPDLEALHAWQQRWARFQAIGIAQHLRRAGKPVAADVVTDWPLLPSSATT
jgi:DNA polymerase-3 subunit epsilon